MSQFPGAEPVLRKVPELIPPNVIESRADMKAGRDLQKDVPFVSQDDFREAGAIAFGTPTRFGNVSALPYSVQELFTTQGGDRRARGRHLPGTRPAPGGGWPAAAEEVMSGYALA